MQETPVQFLSQEDLLEKGKATPSSILCLPWWKNLPAMQEIWVQSLGWGDPLDKGYWPGEFHGLYSPWGHKEFDMTERPSLSPHWQGAQHCAQMPGHHQTNSQIPISAGLPLRAASSTDSVTDCSSECPCII